MLRSFLVTIAFFGVLPLVSQMLQRKGSLGAQLQADTGKAGVGCNR